MDHDFSGSYRDARGRLIREICTECGKTRAEIIQRQLGIECPGRQRKISAVDSFDEIRERMLALRKEKENDTDPVFLASPLTRLRLGPPQKIEGYGDI